jgi:1-acyl-sn-glycerol-3-phosphate acyltransferase
MRALLHTILVRLLVFFVLLFSLVPFSLIALMPRRYRFKSRFAFWVVDLFYRAVLRLLLVPITIHNRHYLPDEPAIFAANHQSTLDIPLLGALCGGKPHIWLARADLLESVFLRIIIPIFAIVVDLTSPSKASSATRNLLRLAQETKAHILLFPEGARYTDGKVHDFLNGYVFIAKRTGRPLVPVAILGVNLIYPPGQFLLYSAPIHVVIGKPFQFGADETDEAFKQRVYDWFEQQMR